VVGEVLVRGFNVMTEYFNDPAGTRQAVDPEGWLHTGDVGFLGTDGYLRIVDRKKDIVIVGGFNVSSAEVEAVLLQHPDIAQAAVVAMPDTRLGEVTAAFVVTRADQQPDPAQLALWCRDRMANFKVPRRVEIVAALPLNASGKVLKRELRERLTAPHDESASDTLVNPP
jgi:acyl-CoA synthetase (AMP-forming)/AMP-acid ligase II